MKPCTSYCPFSEILWLTFFILAAGYFISKRLKRYLRFFQIEEYNHPRFVKWLFANSAYDKRASLTSLICWFAVPLLSKEGIYDPFLNRYFFLGLGFLVLSIFEIDPTKSGKVKLNMTERAKRIYRIAYILTLAIFIGALLLNCCFGELNLLIASITGSQVIPFSLIASNYLLKPVESKIQSKFLNEAKAKIRALAPYTIGITGSYGKTSCKNILGEFVGGALGSTFVPPKSINTSMGITREIRERLQPEHKYAVIEMGAFLVGDIKKRCEIAPPNAALITIVGLAHLERFGSEENVFLAKSELAQALPADGILVCNGDNPGSRKIAETYPSKTTLLYGLNPSDKSLDCWASDVKEDNQSGTQTFTIHWQNKTYQAKTKLLGKTSVYNIIGCFTMACALGADPNYLLALLANIEPVDNRLKIKKDQGITYIQDAYNSNPEGFKSALQVLQTAPAKRKILLTPGMIELGEKQAEENKNVAAIASEICDLIIIVGHVNREALLEGCKNNKAEISLAENRTEAFELLKNYARAEDAVLIENDLPDLYEHKESF
ncbi:MAG TPA: UDP-N-acetylmuramoyl-tripeptide--D-alanyl-D-alanine ligase [Oligoflexia bacterium]|nr:UDP-N-acetylmuramoyl-tripeptide--D-alanyl-D-alanine ligase [Oligoflexia bacterium]HMP27930.1 UDP-N-acetylmuramoyl-tripeptide--D-alanyl-D-alanine ligase [Oligoflexia bacterium]